MAKQPVRWGIISTAGIAESAFIPAVKESQQGQVVAVASRSRSKAEAFAKKHDIPQVFDDYASLLASDTIDAVYNPLPNTMHAEWTIKAAQQGKHIFCEKPLAMSGDEAREMIQACQDAGVLLLDAFVFLLHPQSLKLRELLDQGAIGTLLQVQAHLCFHLKRPTDNIRLNRDLGGGGLLDAGGYPITFTRFVYGQEPEAVQALIAIDPDYGVDTRATMLLSFADNRSASLYTGLDAMGGPGAILLGDKGYINVPQPFHPKAQSHFVVHNADGERRYDIDTGLVTFTPAVEHFQTAILEGTDLAVKPDYAIGTLNIIRAALEAGRTGQRIAL
jgi:predicted dehydrogenase